MLKAIVNYIPGSAKVRTATEVIILEDTNALATAKLGGKYSQEQAIREFRKFPTRFNKIVQLDDVFQTA